MENSSSPVKSYVIVITALGCLTGLTVFLSYLHLPHAVAIPLAILIALTKCSLIASVFMHLKWERKPIYWFIFTSFFLVAVLVLALIPDVGMARP